MLVTADDKFGEYLKSKGLKFTPERRAILKEIFSFHEHFNVDQLYERLGRRISRATIYRTLSLLIESKLIEEIFRCQDRTSYEHIFGHPHHDHMLCIKCGKVIEFREDKIEKLQKAVCERHNFKSVEHRLVIKGYCEECAKNKGT
ncbi:MAG: Fur family transcriptional regulator [candidate division WOR-3 bacterium]|nr:Fur family transcriptional regulator [candidate division WOR-3 bacterium]